MASGQPSGAAQRRRQRRLRSWWRHEQQSIAAALAAATHHSAQQNGALRSLKTATRAREEAGSETYNAPRGPKTLPPGVRPAPLAEVAGPQGRLEAAARVSAGVPGLVPVALSSADDGVDAAALSFFVSKALVVEEEERQRAEQVEAEKKRQTQERRRRFMRREMVEELFALGNLPTARRTPSVERRIAELAAAIDSGDSSAPPRRKRKKRRKRKLPKCGCRLFPPGCGRPWIINKFQQSKLYMFVTAPQLQFINRLVDILVLRAETCTHSAYCAGLRLTSVVSASVRRLSLTRSTPSTSCLCHPSVVALSLCRVVVEVSLLMVLMILFGTV